MYQLRTLEIALFAILIFGSASACKSDKDCKALDTKCTINATIDAQLKLLGVEKKTAYFPCENDKTSIFLELDVKAVCLCVSILVPENNKNCVFKISKLELLKCGHILHLEISEPSKVCVLNVLTVSVQYLEVKLDKKATNYNLIGSLYKTLFGPDCYKDVSKDDCDKDVSKDCSDSCSSSSEEKGGLLGDILGTLI